MMLKLISLFAVADALTLRTGVGDEQELREMSQNLVDSVSKCFRAWKNRHQQTNDGTDVRGTAADDDDDTAAADQLKKSFLG